MNVKHANKSQLTTFLSLIKNFFIYLYLLPRPHRRRLFVASLVSEYRSYSPNFLLILSFIPEFVGFLLIVTLFPSELWRESLEFALPAAPFVMLSFLFLDFSVFFGSTSYGLGNFILRYSHYAQTPQFQNKTKRRQIILLDTMRDRKTRWGWGYVLCSCVPVIFFAVLTWAFIVRGFDPLFVGTCLVFTQFIAYFIFPLAFDGVATYLPRRFLYSLHIAKHGSISKEITDIVDKAWELYPEKLKRRLARKTNDAKLHNKKKRFSILELIESLFI